MFLQKDTNDVFYTYDLNGNQDISDHGHFYLDRILHPLCHPLNMNRMFYILKVW